MQRLLLLNGKRYRYYSSVNIGHRLSNIPKAYHPVDFEAKVLKKWTGRKRTALAAQDHTQAFRMIFPPPNITGKLHLGHALTAAIQDSIVRLKLMRGQSVEWIPGFDHAGIATHSVVSRKMSRKGDADQTALRAELENHALTNRENIRSQLQSLGALLDWNREYYTMDENHSYVVKEAFLHLFENGMISRRDGLVNWCFALKSSIADIEVDEMEFKGRTSLKVPGYEKPVDFGLLYHCSYQLQDSDAKLVVVTSRPETMFGDVAIAVNPNDTRNQEHIGKLAVHPLNGSPIPVIPDSRVKIDFGTGLVKITPAHDKLDFVIGTDHNLPIVKIFHPDGTLNDKCGKFKGIPRYSARQEVLKVLKDSGCLADVVEYNGSLGICSRTQDVIEPLLLPHWFFRTKQVSEALVTYIKNGEFLIRPEYLEHVFLHHMNSVQDWCISRQIKWGHSIPAFYHQDFPEQWVAASSKSDAKQMLEDKLKVKIPSQDLVHQDPDVLDTWFSSALIPLALSNWPDVDSFKEISLLETGHDILLFWIWRMCIMNLALIEKLPFRSVLLHGVVIDSYGRKMSKSRGNVIDSMHVIEGRGFKELSLEAAEALKSGELDKAEYDLRMFALEKDYPNGIPSCGADALRFALLAQDIQDQDVTISVAYLENCKHFCNKLWQAMRMYLHYAEEGDPPALDFHSLTPAQFSSLPLIDRWILSSFYEFIKVYETNVRSCGFHLVTDSIRTFFYSQYCDVYLEFVKLELKQKLNVTEHLQVMRYVLLNSLKFAHPFLPFVTEEVWGVLTEDKEGLLIDTRQPALSDLAQFKNHAIAEQMEKVLKLIKQVRSFKIRYFPGFKEPPTLLVEIHKDDVDLMEMKHYMENLSKVFLKFDILGLHPTSDSLYVIFDIGGGRMCRVSCSRSEEGVVIPSIDETKLVKLQAKLAKLKKQYESSSFQEKAPTDAKERLRKKVELLQSKIDEASSSPDNQPQDSQS